MLRSYHLLIISLIPGVNEIWEKSMMYGFHEVGSNILSW